MLPFIIAGITTGSVYGLAGVGLVLTYKTSGVFNFAYGALATLSAFAFYSLHVAHGMPWPLAAGICVLVIGPAIGMVLELVARPLARSRLAVQVVATVGILLVIQSIVLLVYGAALTRTVPQFLPTSSFRIDGTPVRVSDLVVIGVGLLAVGFLFVFFRRTRNGVAMRAVVDDPGLLDLSGTNPNASRRYAWVIGVCLASASGLLLAPLITLDGTTLTLLVVQAFGAAAIGRFQNLPLTYVGGLVIGVASSVATKYFTNGLLAKLPSGLPFAILFLVLLFSRRDGALDRSGGPTSGRIQWRAPWQVQSLIGVALLIVLGFGPQIAGFHLTDWILFLTSTILFLSLGLLVRTSGQVSLAHVTFTAIGACAFSHFAVDQHFPWLVALGLSGLVAVPIGALLAIPAIRLSGLYLALATFGFGIVVASMFYTQAYMFGSLGVGLTEPRPKLSGLDVSSDRGYYYLVLLFTVMVTFATLALTRGRLGRLLRAAADSARGLETSGTSLSTTRVIVFCLSAFLAAVAGSLGGVAQQTVVGDSYSPFISLTFYVVVIIAFGGEPWYAFLAAAGVSLVPSYLPGQDTGYYLDLIFGIAAVLYALTPEARRGVPGPVMAVVDRFSRRGLKGQRDATRRPRPSVLERERVPEGKLRLEHLKVEFGGVVAVDDLTIEMHTGMITGLIGPNGAGKTTTFNAISGLNRPASGAIMLNGSGITHYGPAARARHGLGRTFQQMELFDSLTVDENVRLGYEGSFAGANPLGHLLSSRARAEESRAVAAQMMELCGIKDLATRQVGALSTGQRRLVEFARSLATNPRFLLLDEPSSGLDRNETDRFALVLRKVVSERGLGLLLVEHDMTLVTSVCDHIYVLDFGRQIFEGSASEVMTAPIVQAAYLGGGDAAAEEALNGMAETAAGRTS